MFFESPAELRAWFEAHHETEPELIVGLWKAHTGRATVTWALAVREALCFGWIDGQAKRIDGERHWQRFTPRKSRRWSAVNVRLVGELTEAGLMRPAGLRAFEARDRSEVPYSTSDRPDQLDPEHDAALRADAEAAAFWDTLPPSYRKTCAFWVSSAKRPETRARRLDELLAGCRAHERLAASPRRESAEATRQDPTRSTSARARASNAARW